METNETCRKVKLVEITEWVSSLPYSRSYESGIDTGLKYIHYGDIHADSTNAYKGKYINSDPNRQYALLTEGDIVFADASEDLKDLGKATYLRHKPEVDTIAGLHTHCLRPNKNILNSAFFFFYTQSPSYKKYIKKVGNGISVYGLSKKNLEKLEFSLPSLPEQEKIAEFLSAFDDHIELREKRIKLLTQQKKGYVQQIFSRKLRFRDDNGNEYPEWEEKKLGNIVEKITTGKLDANQGSPLGEYRFYTCASTYKYIDTYAHDTEALLISGNGANVGYIHYYKGKFNAYQRTYILYPSGNASLRFLKFYLEKFLPARISLEKNAGSMPYIVLNTLSDMLIYLPTFKEQEKIANFLSALDDQITLEKEKLAQLKLQKQGYMQRIFK